MRIEELLEFWLCRQFLFQQRPDAFGVSARSRGNKQRLAGTLLGVLKNQFNNAANFCLGAFGCAFVGGSCVRTHCDDFDGVRLLAIKIGRSRLEDDSVLIELSIDQTAECLTGRAIADSQSFNTKCSLCRFEERQAVNLATDWLESRFNLEALGRGNRFVAEGNHLFGALQDREIFGNRGAGGIHDDCHIEALTIECLRGLKR